ncbi:MAG: glycosyltransferase family 2 protein [Candidatus Amulumruptor caecigallinarius]|nr:glycosyltransferase family 2 protein [Candidatus Amulumruptor caecigallinarius]MCM1396388.1 glycosyltransferase family 2 protein [Candidatus Amulumruptor caecigallinarius]MCM1453555.1 glycosyltransferase family 2 protein [bacterium]
MRGEIAVIVPVRDGARTIGRALRSVLRQSLPPAEVLVVLNGTTDGTAAEVRLFGDAVKMVSLPAGDLSAARCAGVAATTAPLVLFMDADDELHPRALAEAAEAMRLRRADVVQMRMMQTFRLRGGLTVKRPLPCEYRMERGVEGALGNVREFHPAMIGKLFRREVLTPMPDTGYHGFWGEDRLFTLELYVRGGGRLKTVYCPRARYHYTWGGGSATPEAPEADEAFREVYGLMEERLEALGLGAYRGLLRSNLERLLAERARAARPSVKRVVRRVLRMVSGG